MDYRRQTAQKKALDALRPLSPDLVANLENWFRVELTYTSNALEGNTLSRKETAIVVEKGLTVQSKSLREHLEAVNHAKVFDVTLELISKNKKTLREEDILKLHSTLLRGIDDDNAGRYRSVSVRIAGSPVVLPNPAKVPQLMSDFVKWLGTKKKIHPVEKAALAHYQFVSIHPFTDGNGRMGRLLMNFLLMREGYPPAIIQKRERLPYIDSLESAQLGDSLEPFLALVAKSVERSLGTYLTAAQNKGVPKQQKNTQDKKLLRIGELAKLSGESVSTIRHWTAQELLAITDKTNAGYQLYSPKMVSRAKKIRALQKERWTLAEIAKKL